jgi:hypothetical protein
MGSLEIEKNRYWIRRYPTARSAVGYGTRKKQTRQQLIHMASQHREIAEAAA